MTNFLIALILLGQPSSPESCTITMTVAAVCETPACSAALPCRECERCPPFPDSEFFPETILATAVPVPFPKEIAPARFDWAAFKRFQPQLGSHQGYIANRKHRITIVSRITGLYPFEPHAVDFYEQKIVPVRMMLRPERPPPWWADLWPIDHPDGRVNLRDLAVFLNRFEGD